MNPNFRVASIDGYGERDDIALERFHQEGKIEENKLKELDAIDKAVSKAREYGTASNAEKITGIVQAMLERECYSKLLLKSEFAWDVETISEAVTEACIQLGLDDEQFAPNIHDQGNEIDIRLF